MTIAVQISLSGTENDLLDNFNYQCFSLLAGDHPNDHFIFIFDSPFDPSLINHSNITPVILGPEMKNSLLQYYWYNFKLPRILNKYNASIFISSNHICSLRTEAEQTAFIKDVHVFRNRKLRDIKKYASRFINEAEEII